MKKLLILCIAILMSNVSKADGVLIVDAFEGIYLKKVNSEITVDVTNQVAIIKSKQRFVNTTGSATQIKYAFPMPETAAATQLKWLIDGEWKYASFAASEQDTTLPGGGSGGTVHSNLVTYLGETPLYFSPSDTISVNDTIEFEVTYVQLLDYFLNEVTFKYPGNYSLIQSSIIEQSQSIEFNLYSERTIQSISMDTYAAQITNNGTNAQVSYVEYESYAVGEYQILYELASDELGIIPFSNFLPDSLQTCDSLGNGFLGLVIEPESNENTEVIEKNFTLIIDNSGSMSGNKIVQAKEAATFVVDNLNTGDFFNVIRFNTSVESFRPNHVEYTTTNQNEALNFISQTEAGGGTNISDALVEAVSQFGALDTTKANIIIFFTDGQATVGETSTDGILSNVEAAINYNETNVFLFTFGIGDYVSEQLLTLLATQNQGFAEFIGDDEIEDVISRFYLTVRNPVLLNTQIEFSPDIITEVYPNPAPNLYKGMQLVLTGRYSEPQDITMTLSGSSFNSNVSYTYNFSLSDTLNDKMMFLPKLWARGKIEHLTNLYYALPESSAESDSVKTLIEEISLCYQVISTFTSFTDDNYTFIEELLEENEEFSVAFNPNPFKNRTSVVIELLKPQEIDVYIYDINGRLVNVIHEQGFAGENEIVWNGNDSNGQLVKKGVYFYKIISGENAYFGKLIKE